jgi:alpha,alpha-trehalase
MRNIEKICRLAIHGFCVVVFIFLFAAGAGSGAAISQPGPAGLKPILDYISAAWDTLMRSMSECKSIADPKIAQASILYLPAGFEEPAAVQKLQLGCNVKVEHLPQEIHRLGEISSSNIDPPGLLYLPNEYVVPGGRFNEMYGWDSYFIVRGLLQAGRFELARGMTENLFFEIENYGGVLNANRTYYLTRSQPPFLSSMVVDVYGASANKLNRAWLERAYTDLEKDYRMWTSEPHLAGDTGLSRYYDFGDGPPPEAAKDENGYYRKVATYFFFHPARADGYLVDKESNAKEPVAGANYTLQVCESEETGALPACDHPKNFKLSADYYKGDRSMRESGFDVSFRFGPFGAATHHYAPVCLNTLLYKNEKDLEQISRWLGREADAQRWSQSAEERKKLITRYLWDAQKGMFFDYDFEKKELSTYDYAATFYPLWAGLATTEQAKAIDRNLKTFERPGGLSMSTEDTGAQWDLPYGWGNIEMLAVKGLRQYGFEEDADRISHEFLSMVADNFRRDGNIREKYNVVTRSSEARVELGYQMNVVGFGWTNAAFLELLHALPHATAERLAREESRKRAPVAAGAGSVVRGSSVN